MSASTLKFIAYRYSDSEVIAFLRKQEYDIFYVADGDGTIDEAAVCQKANAENYVMLTADEATADKLLGEGRIQSGILLIKLNENEAVVRAKIVADALEAHSSEIPFGYSVLTKQNWKTKRMGTA